MARRKKSGSGAGGLLLIVAVIFLGVKDPKMLSSVINGLTSAASSAGANVSGGQVGHTKEQNYAQSIFGISNSDMNNCLIPLWNQESGWSDEAVNQQSGAYGIPQALPSVWGHPYPLGDWKAQIDWGKWYIDHKYGGSVCAAEAHEQSHNWY